MRRILFLFLVLLPIATAWGQDARFNIQGGVTLTNNDITHITSSSIKQGKSYAGFCIGPSIDFEAKHLLGLDIAALYSQSSMELEDREQYQQQFILLPVSLTMRLGLPAFKVIAQIGPQWNMNIGDIKEFFEDGEYISASRVVTTVNAGAGIRLFNRVDAMVNYNVPLQTLKERQDDLKDIVRFANAYSTLQFILSLRF